jgi:hypothetical protein
LASESHAWNAIADAIAALATTSAGGDGRPPASITASWTDSTPIPT